MSDNKYRRFVEAEIDIAAPRELVWSAWTQPGRLAGWLPERVTGEARQHQLVTWHYDSADHHVVFRVDELDAPEHLRMSEHAKGSQRGYRVDLSVGEGDTTHAMVRGYGVPPGEDHVEMRACATSGLTLSLHRLELYVTQYLDRPRRQVFVSRTGRFEYEQIARRFHSAAGLGAWLGETATDLVAGSPYELTLAGGETATGEVLAVTPHAVIASWRELEGALELRAFPTGQGPRVVSIRVTSWAAEQGLELDAGAVGDALDLLLASLAESAA